MPPEKELPACPASDGAARPAAWGVFIRASLVIALYIGAQVGVASVAGPWALGREGVCFTLGVVLAAPPCIWLTYRAALAASGGTGRAGAARLLGMSGGLPRASLVAGYSLALLALMGMAEVVRMHLGRPVVQEVWLTLYRGAGGWTWALGLAIVLIGPVFEELLLRGYVGGALLEGGMGPLPAGIYTSAFWALVHLQYDPVDMTFVFCLGLLLFHARMRTRSVYAPLAIHALNNAASFGVLAYNV